MSLLRFFALSLSLSMLLLAGCDPRGGGSPMDAGPPPPPVSCGAGMCASGELCVGEPSGTDAGAGVPSISYHCEPTPVECIGGYDSDCCAEVCSWGICSESRSDEASRYLECIAG